MTPTALIMERPRLFSVDDQATTSLEDVVLQVLADADHGSCPVCDGRTHAIAGGARCEDCGTEIVVGAEPVALWAA